jgi:hypothetical protein
MKMNFNNAVYADNTRKTIIGYRCRECNGVFQSMWGCGDALVTVAARRGGREGEK